ncbi:MAG: ABC transporter permease [Chryseolinea sp.]
MFKNYITAGIRSLLKHRFYSMLNISGLALGLAASLLLTTWIIHELSYDNFHEQGNRIYRSSLEYSFGGQTAKTSVSPTALLPFLEKNFAEVEKGVRVYNPTAYNPYIVRHDDKAFEERQFFYADSTFFQIFTFPLLEGNPTTALTEPNSIVLTRSSAKKYFGEEDPIGKTVQVNNNKEYAVTGVIDDVPTNSLLQFDFVASFSTLDASKQQIWWSANYQTYVLLALTADVTALSAKTQELVMKELSSELGNPGDYVKYNFIPLSDIYLKSDMDESTPVSDIQYVYIFGAIAALILLIACINYVNLATARASERAKEVGVRKVVGAARRQLVFQFIGESVIITSLSLVIALILAKLAVPAFNALTGKSFLSGLIFNPTSIGLIVLISAFIALAAGAYPAIAITSFKPAQVLKGNFKSSNKGIWLRKSLVVFQFCISVMLIVGTLVVSKQLDYIQNKKLGYERERVIMLPLDSKTELVYDQMKNEILKNSNAVDMARATESPTSIAGGYSIKLEGSGNSQAMIVAAMSIDKEFIPTLSIALASGRNFTDADFQKAAQDTINSFILNESALHELGLTNEKAIGLKISMNGRKGDIVGVIKDFHFAPLQKEITPLVLFNEVNDFSYTFIKLNSGNPSEALARIQQTVQTLAPHRPFEYTFLDDEYNTLYSNEQRMGKIVTTFATLVVIIACLGLLGLVSFSAAQKTKEIGIRKVLGATPYNIVVLITKDFAVLVVIAIVIGLPGAYYLMSNWLREFAYKTDIGVLPILIASLLCLVIAFGTASYQAIQASMMNPSKTLRSE